tara:strand:- start:316 stop:483 length:168 start_codon:yes stop_codon:yes gene_type:complete
MTAKILFAFSFVALVGLQGVSLALNGRTGKVLGRVSYLFAVIAICSYAVFIKDVI